MSNTAAAGSPAPIAARPEFTSPLIEAAKSDPNLPEKVSRFQTLASTVLDTSGKFTESERLQAYVSTQEMAATGQLMGMGNAGMDLLAQVHRGDVGQKSQQLQSAHAAAVMGFAGDGPSATRAALGHFDSLSSSDQSILFQTGINPPLRDGKKFASVQGWRDNMNAAIQMGEYTQANRELIASGAAAKPDDAKFAAALKLSQADDVGSAAWSSLVLKLFDRPQDKVDLSDDAKRMIGDAQEAPRSQARYQEGSIASKTV